MSADGDFARLLIEGAVGRPAGLFKVPLQLSGFRGSTRNPISDQSECTSVFDKGYHLGSVAFCEFGVIYRTGLNRAADEDFDPIVRDRFHVTQGVVALFQSTTKFRLAFAMFSAKGVLRHRSAHAPER